MRKITIMLTALVLGAFAGKAQTVDSFESNTLPLLQTADTFYVNFSNSGNDVGFSDAEAHYPCVYDTSFGGYWSSGFVYSNMTDSVTSGFVNQYSAKTAAGVNGSHGYLVGYGTENHISITDTASDDSVRGFYITNNTYAYNSMRDGDGFARKFGDSTMSDTSGNYPDWFKVTITGYLHGISTAVSVNFYLADFRFADNDSDYIVNTWQWVDLTTLGHVDSVDFVMSSSDTSFGFINTPTYYCIDNFTTGHTAPSSVANTPVVSAVKVYPNPVSNQLFVETGDNAIQHISLCDATGRVLSTTTVSDKKTIINTTALAAGMYVLQLEGNGKVVSAKFVKN